MYSCHIYIPNSRRGEVPFLFRLTIYCLGLKPVFLGGSALLSVCSDLDISSTDLVVYLPPLKNRYENI
ncbi:hypothetical protein WAI453_002475 [Rhynchosporium graminicola]